MAQTVACGLRVPTEHGDVLQASVRDLRGRRQADVTPRAVVGTGTFSVGHKAGGAGSKLGGRGCGCGGGGAPCGKALPRAWWQPRRLNATRCMARSSVTRWARHALVIPAQWCSVRLASLPTRCRCRSPTLASSGRTMRVV